MNRKIVSHNRGCGAQLVDFWASNQKVAKLGSTPDTVDVGVFLEKALHAISHLGGQAVYPRCWWLSLIRHANRTVLCKGVDRKFSREGGATKQDRIIAKKIETHHC